MGVCYSCSGCGKCRTWMADLENACPFCRYPVGKDNQLCPSCGKPLPLPPGTVRKKQRNEEGESLSLGVGMSNRSR